MPHEKKKVCVSEWRAGTSHKKNVFAKMSFKRQNREHFPTNKITEELRKNGKKV